MKWKLQLGANWIGDQVRFKVWAPKQQKLSILINDHHCIEMNKDEKGYFNVEVSGLKQEDTYCYLLSDSQKRADPVSRFLPEGLFKATSLMPYEFAWNDQQWKGIKKNDLIFYECHVGTYTKEGTFDALIEKIPYLKELGITCLEIMPINECPGKWNWGYDGASLYSVNRNYGDPLSLKRLVNACHMAEIAVCLDVVYNHLGPEGNFIAEFGDYTSSTYKTPWGNALNFDGPGSNEVREFIIQNALYWIFEYHIDALRLDAIHGIYDFNAKPVLELFSQEIKKHTKTLQREISLFVENDHNDARVLRPFSKGGWSFEGAWNDDFHHAVHVEFTKESAFYYKDFHGFKDILTALQKGYIYQGKYSSFRNRNHGNFAEDIPLIQFVTFIQNHDQVGNRPKGERLNQLTSFENLKLAAGLNILSPSLPLLFMGEEWAEEAPFLYFVDYENNDLMQSVVQGRKVEFSHEEVVHPGEEAFLKSKLSSNNLQSHQVQLLNYYKDLIQLRKSLILHKETVIIEGSEKEQWISLFYEQDLIFILFAFSNLQREIQLPSNISLLVFNSEESAYNGSKTPLWDNVNSSVQCSSPLVLIFKCQPSLLS